MAIWHRFNRFLIQGRQNQGDIEGKFSKIKNSVNVNNYSLWGKKFIVGASEFRFS